MMIGSAGETLTASEIVYRIYTLLLLLRVCGMLDDEQRASASSVSGYTGGTTAEEALTMYSTYSVFLYMIVQTVRVYVLLHFFKINFLIKN